jgi:hypothetical protein
MAAFFFAMARRVLGEIGTAGTLPRLTQNEKSMARKTSSTPLQHRQFAASPSLYRFLGSTDNFVYSDERFRPTWQPRRSYLLTTEHRHQLCIHTAAHAVVSNLGGAWVHMLAVAPAGVRSWTIADRKSLPLGKIWGICSTSDFYCSHIAWDDNRQIYVADREGWESQLENLYESLRNVPGSAASEKQACDFFPEDCPTEELFIAENRRVVRAQACGYVAGHIADGISAGMTAGEALTLYDRRDSEYVGPSDIAAAQGLSDLLPMGEYENVVQATEEALRRPENWQAVMRLASELERFGLLENDECEADMYLHLPGEQAGWPAAPC